MANDYFSFKQFTIRQDLCGMKVGTDGTLLGAWAKGRRDDSTSIRNASEVKTERKWRILDIGTGTGLIALMMAQRFPEAEITGIDIDEKACEQARENVEASPFRTVEIKLCDVKEMKGVYDVIVSNPPYFVDSLENPDDQRRMARHTSSLSYRELMENAFRLLSDDGEFSLVIPSETKAQLEEEAYLAGFFKSRECAVKTTPRKQPRRYLLAFRKHAATSFEKEEGVIEKSPNVRSDWYQQLTQDFYLLSDCVSQDNGNTEDNC